MKDSLTIVIGGIQGEGIVSTGVDLIKILSRLGYYGFGSRRFSSRIKGGNTNIQVTISTRKITAVEDKIDIILALDKDTIACYREELKEDGIILYDNLLTIEETENAEALPMTEIAKRKGSPIMKTTAALAFLGKVLDIPSEILGNFLDNRFGHKGEKIQSDNMAVLEEALIYEEGIHERIRKSLASPMKKISRPVMIGNEAIALGALMAGCRFMAAYPITPASEIMEFLGAVFPKYGGSMLQVEDEIAAINMAMGAGYAGVRSMTATSGPGISLMTEGIGMAGMAEIPVVIVDCQRVGPSTGMPTKHEQSDLFTLYYGGHGDYPAIILTPSTVEECFEDTGRAFNLAEKYQCPVILVSDLMLSLSPQTIDPLDYEKIKIDRGSLLKEKDLESIVDGKYKRFTLTEEGISPRSIPGMKNGIHHVTNVEHTENGLPTEDSEIRKQMMEKRFRKMELLKKENTLKVIENDSDFLFIAIGSTFGVLKEAVEASGNKVDFGSIRMLKPLPAEELSCTFEKYKKIIVIENNFSQQLTAILKEKIGKSDKIEAFTKYDGTPFTITEIIEKIGGMEA
ncbi:2-oxoglutarate ferredoxin oxidoreductase subunit alpha [Natronincola peptidivorans]|uniref:2-oxoglutarate ferredoxin oxidoreductase subunit alpha n=1 Tax=Natronincola peptidivorans TaxID=426128 RepID=A0A1I0DW49_9FIRM|nr:2-oxoacid:acceptor oxidoreductase subunit alpha [Natronincola peptidivorans]SET36865.1 2-oxoglutarate ferredoxin oxidoreductase subunit alpha [Natronincola peptidivorans]